MLEWTGERYLPFIDPSVCGAEIHYEHLHRYAFASQYVKGKKVLDLASGEGFGSSILAQSAQCVMGVDMDHETVLHASRTYKSANISFIEGSILNIPIKGRKIFDVIICFEAIEHVGDHDSVLHEITRLLKDDGILIISTPNKKTYSDDTGYMNPFHQKELNYPEFLKLLKTNFTFAYLSGQRVFSGSSIFPVSSEKITSSSEFVIERVGSHFSFSEVDEPQPRYFIAIASNIPLDPQQIQKSYLIDKSNAEIALLNDRINQSRISINTMMQTITTKDQQIQEQTARIQEQTARIQEQAIRIISLNQKLLSIENSAIWQLNVKFHLKVINQLLPYNSQRRELCKLGLKGGKILINYGPKIFWRSFQRCLRARKMKMHQERFAQSLESYENNGTSLPESQLTEDQLFYRQMADTLPDPNSVSDVSSCDILSFIPCPAPTVSIIIPVYNKWQYTYNCLKSILENTENVPYEVIIADDGSSDQTSDMLQKIEGIKAIKNEHNLGYLKNCNNAAQFSNGKYLVFLNNDTYVMKGWLESLIKPAKKNDAVAIVGPNLISTEGSLLENGWIIGIDGWGQPIGRGDDPSKYDYNYLKEVDCVTGACLLIKREIFLKAGSFDESFSPAYYEEFDFAFSVRKMGYKVILQPESKVIHYDNSSYGEENRAKWSVKNHKKFMERWGTLLKNRMAISYDYFLARDNASDKEVILIIDEKVPDYDVHAGSLMMYQYVKLFQEMGFKVIFLPDDREKTEPYITELQQLGIEVIYGIFDFDSWIKTNGKYLDYVLLSRPLISIKYIHRVKANSNAKILYCMHDLHYLRELRRYQVEKQDHILKESQEFKEIEFTLFNTSDILLTFSDAEAAIISRELPHLHNIEVIPLFAYDDFPERSSLAPFDKRRNLIFLGGFKHLPNVDAVVWFVKECLPAIRSQNPDIKFIIIGSNPPDTIKDLASENIIVTGQIQDLKPYFDDARVFVSPLRYGAGIKGKLVTSMYYGVPIVTTTIGAEGLKIIDGQTGLVADDPAHFASKVTEMYTNRDLWERLASNSLNLVRNTFSKQAAREKILTILKMQKCPVCDSFHEVTAPANTTRLQDPPDCSRCKDTKSKDVGGAQENAGCAEPARGEGITNNDEGLICLHPFYSMLIFQNYNIYNCVCLDWIKQRIGNLETHSLLECWNSETARFIRLKMYAGEWQEICNPICPVIIEYLESGKLMKYKDLESVEELTPTLIEEIRARKDFLTSPPTHFKLDNSNVCNLHCIMCGRDAYNDNPDLQKKFMAELQNYLPSTKKMMLCGHGDPLARPDTRGILMNHKGSIKFDIITNGLLLPKYWDKIKHQRFGLFMISMDGATKEIYEKIRAGGRWENILESLSLVKQNKDSFESVTLNMTVMRSNYQEIPQFIDFAESYGFNVYFQGIRGAYPDENIFETHDIRAINKLKNIIAHEKNKKRSITVAWGNLTAYVN